MSINPVGEVHEFDDAPMTLLLRLTKDIKDAARTLSPNEARYLVDAYYQMQEHRKAASNQVRSLDAAGEPNTTISWFSTEYVRLEASLKKVLDVYSDAHPVGAWAKSITGIGPVIAAGLLAHIDITKAPTVGHIWSFAGLNPTSTWGKGEKRPWNADLKVLCWKIGQSFVKVSNNPNDIYGHLYAQRKMYEIERNEVGLLADQAELALSRKRIGKDTVAYKSYVTGKLPPAHIDARARRWVVKLFLAHFHEVSYFETYGTLPPAPYSFAVLDHVHRIEVPNADLVSGLPEARRAYREGLV